MQHPNARSIEGRVALVTGAASGIGAATAVRLLENGAKVIATDVTRPDVAAYAGATSPFADNCLALDMDVTRKLQVAEAIALGAAHFGGLDILVNNAGIKAACAIESDRFDDIWDSSLAVMLTGPKNCFRAALPFLRRSDCARVVNISSIEGLEASKGAAPYSAAKAGLIGLTRSLAVEFGTEGITVNCICPGPIETPMTSDVADEHRRKYLDRYTALHRAGQPEEIADMILNICLPSSAFMTGSIVVVDGGLIARST
ncbi:MAG: SDR family NAD(P)-dependent oxidoreductase [Sphingopyxis sp.]|uniref:SDR family NAD(P)-dependent oxidoreductase n=1 Tax=Sphingopyxis sp. TaxID=1908224 RepID=UPI002AB87851|nr:SDR family NAD(P)-dependent oxidoreductase [Sphingopyxis sp.]MDZ3833539.1 SDR family NAD(P)-dependent oxidoreductase [Sphingopyxis sp.]